MWHLSARKLYSLLFNILRANCSKSQWIIKLVAICSSMSLYTCCSHSGILIKEQYSVNSYLTVEYAGPLVLCQLAGFPFFFVLLRERWRGMISMHIIYWDFVSIQELYDLFHYSVESIKKGQPPRSSNWELKLYAFWKF